jgi:hypothetical protein
MNTGAELPRFEVEDRSFTKIILGHNPFLGYSYISRARAREYEERFTSFEPIRDILLVALEAGVRSVMLSYGNERCQFVVQAIEAAQEQTGIEMSNLVIVNPDVREHQDFLQRAACQVCLIHGQTTDSLFYRMERTFRPEFGELAATIREMGYVPGMSTHNGGETIPVAEPFDVAVINTPINKITWRMCPCVEMVSDAVRNSSKKVIAMKTLAMGRVAPEEAMQWIWSVPGVDAIVLGIGTAAEAEETIRLAAEGLGA